MRLLTTCLQILIVLLGGLAVGFAAEPSDKDVVLKALGDELSRSMSLRLEDLEQPYFVQYSVDDGTSYHVSARYGALVSSDQSRSRILHSQLRVGAPQLDNSNFAGRGGFGGMRGLGASSELPTDNDYMALRHAVWSATDLLYKDSVETLTQKRAYMRDRNVADRPPDFSQTTATTAIQDRTDLSFDRSAWEDYVRRISAQFAAYAHIQGAEVNLTAGAETHYLLNSEGSRLRYGETGVLLRITVEAQASDGERFSDSLSYFALLPNQLPKLAEVQADAQQLANRMAATIEAPILEDYTGPVLLDGLAAGQLFRQLLGRGLTAQTDPVGSQRRSAAGLDDLENRLGKRILPVTFHIYDDPRNAKFQDTFLSGQYLFDDEGVPPERVEIVIDGKLQGMVTSRAPTKQFAKSNGHGRRSGGAATRAAIGCLYVESSKGESPEELKKELMDAAEAEGLKYGLRISNLQNRGAGGPGGFAGGFGRRGGAGAGRVVGDPISIYKVYVADGREEPVRGCEFGTLDVRSLRRIIAAGKLQTVHNAAGGGAPASSVIAPAMLFEELEVSRIRQEAEKKPILEAPHARSQAAR